MSKHTLKLNMLVAVSGGIAAYKAPSIISGFKQSLTPDSTISVMQTENSHNFVTKASLSNVSDKYYDMSWNEPVHIKATDSQLDVFVIVPATCNIIGKIANGICDDLITNTAMALNKNTMKLICPACNTRMWENEIFQTNVNKLTHDYNWRLIKPVVGRLTCGTMGIGKLAPTKKLVEEVLFYSI